MSVPGRVLTHPAAARRRFEAILRQPDEVLDLTEAALIIALEEYPTLQVPDYVARLDEWSDAIRERVHGSRDIERVIEEINRVLFEEEGFHGEADDYYDPRVAFLNDVLDRHAGLPISLSILYIEISRRLGIDMAGVPLPGRFLVKVSGPWGEILVDPFDQGRVLSTAECQRIMDQVFGGAVRLHERHLRSSSKREILAMLLSHLKSLYLTHNDIEGAIASLDRLLMIADGDPYDIRERAQLSMQLHQYEEAIAFLERYLELAPHAEDRRRIREEIAWLHAWLDAN